jgi:5-formyltetrahydrofolate cyclo-ligase
MLTPSKSAMRRRMRKVRDRLPADRRRELSRRIAQRTLDLPELVSARSVFLYLDSGSEVGTRLIAGELLDRGVVVGSPVIRGGGVEQAGNRSGGVMLAHRLVSLQQVRPGMYGIDEPTSGRPLEEPPDVTLTPGIAFTPEGFRLGHGGGFYDRYLASQPSTVAIGLAFESQVVAELPHAEHDRPMQRVVTDRRVLICRATSAC